MNLTDTQIRRIVNELADEVVNRLLALEDDGLPDKVLINGEWVDRVPGEQYAQDSAYVAETAAGNAKLAREQAEATIAQAKAEGPRNDPQRSENNPEGHVNKPDTASAAKAVRREAEALEAGMRRAWAIAGESSQPADLGDSDLKVSDRRDQTGHQCHLSISAADLAGSLRRAEDIAQQKLAESGRDREFGVSGEFNGVGHVGHRSSPSVDVGALTVGERAAHTGVGGTTNGDGGSFKSGFREFWTEILPEIRRDRAAWGSVAGLLVLAAAVTVAILGVIAAVLVVAS